MTPPGVLPRGIGSVGCRLEGDCALPSIRWCETELYRPVPDRYDERSHAYQLGYNPVDLVPVQPVEQTPRRAALPIRPVRETPPAAVASWLPRPGKSKTTSDDTCTRGPSRGSVG